MGKMNPRHALFPFAKPWGDLRMYYYLFLIGALALGIGCTPDNQSPSTEIEPAALSGTMLLGPDNQPLAIVRKSPADVFQLGIAIPIDTWNLEANSIKKRLTLVNSSESEFYVVLTNMSNKNQLICEDWCSWGYFDLYFEILDNYGDVVHKISKVDMAWDEDQFDYSIVEPGENYVRKVVMNDETWKMPKAADLPEGAYEHVQERWRSERESLTFRMRAVYSAGGSEIRSKIDVYEFRYPGTNW
jgi:hypothetical protein